MLPLNTFCRIDGEITSHPIKVLSLEEALSSHYPFERVAIKNQISMNMDVSQISKLGFKVIMSEENLSSTNIARLHSVRNPDVINNGDVIRIRPENGQVTVLFRRGANANSLFVTEKCNSKCLMCSQPPTENDDYWLTNEILELIPLIDKNVDFLGITGGEPTLIDERLAQIIHLCKKHLPTTKLHILSNGRRFSDPQFCQIFNQTQQDAIWAIPLYSDIEHIHDYIVQSKNAYNETINGIYNIAELGHSIEIRTVLQRETFPRIKEYAEFLYRNFSFVDHIAFMGLEPMGYAKKNYNNVWVDPKEYGAALVSACSFLENRGMQVSIYNVPHCLLPESGHRFARKSISDWKNIYFDECIPCMKKHECCGFFASVGDKWKSAHISAIIE